MEQMGDKIAVFRVTVAKLIAAILKAKKISLSKIKKELDVSLNSKNWFERQAGLILLE